MDDTRSRRDYNQYIIAYDTVQPLWNETLRPAVLLETSYTTVSFPTVVLPVGNHVGEIIKKEAPEMLQEYQLEPFEMKVQGIDRTLVDKVFAVCDYYLQGRVKRYSRHIYDIYKLLPLITQDESFKILVGEVRAVRKISSICPSAQDGVDIPALIGKIIDENVYQRDYQNITERLLEEKVDYDTAVGALKELMKNGMFE